MFFDASYYRWLYCIKVQEVSLEMFNTTTNNITWEQMGELWKEMEHRISKMVECEVKERGKTRTRRFNKIKLEFLDFMNNVYKKEKK